MLRLATRILISALVFAYVLPMIHGIAFHGNLISAIGIAILFGVMTWIVDLIAIALSTVMAISTLGMALLWLIPLWLLGFWLLPVVALKLVANFVPAYLTIAGWLPAVLGGLVLMAVSMITSSSLGRAVRGA